MQLQEKISNFAAFSIAIDESTDITDAAQLAVFVRGFTDKFEIIEIVPIKERTRAENIFCEIITVINTYNLNLDKIVGFTSDSIAFMIGKKMELQKN